MRSLALARPREPERLDAPYASAKRAGANLAGERYGNQLGDPHEGKTVVVRRPRPSTPGRHSLIDAFVRAHIDRRLAVRTCGESVDLERGVRDGVDRREISGDPLAAPTRAPELEAREALVFRAPSIRDEEDVRITGGEGHAYDIGARIRVFIPQNPDQPVRHHVEFPDLAMRVRASVQV